MTDTVAILLDATLPLDWRASVVAPLPSNTTLTITGDGEVIKQIVDHLNGLEIHYNGNKP